jgi:hypothetical protein
LHDNVHHNKLFLPISLMKMSITCLYWSSELGSLLSIVHVYLLSILKVTLLIDKKTYASSCSAFQWPTFAYKKMTISNMRTKISFHRNENKYKKVRLVKSIGGLHWLQFDYEIWEIIIYFTTCFSFWRLFYSLPTFCTKYLEVGPLAET